MLIYIHTHIIYTVSKIRLNIPESMFLRIDEINCMLQLCSVIAVKYSRSKQSSFIILNLHKL